MQRHIKMADQYPPRLTPRLARELAFVNLNFVAGYRKLLRSTFSLLTDEGRRTDSWIKRKNMIRNVPDKSEFRTFKTVFSAQLSILKPCILSKKVNS